MIYNNSVVPPRKIVRLAVALIVLSAPVLACALPGQQMSEEEQSCCLHMADECNGSQMESHSCCNKLPQAGASVLQVTNKYAPVVLDAVPVAITLPEPLAVTFSNDLPRVTASPESPPGQTVLRI